MIGKFRAWIKKKIKDNAYDVDDFHCGECYGKGYEQAMQDVAEYFDFPLDNKLWEKWQP